MKKLIVSVLVLAMLCGCSAEPNHRGEWSEELETLMAEVNAEHEAIAKPEMVDFEQYISTPIGKPVAETAKPNEDGSFSLAQAEADINYLFDVLKKEYGLYDYYGEEAFLKAKEAMLAACKSADNLNANSLYQIIYQELGFIVDNHFSINNTLTSSTMKSWEYPYYCETATLTKTKDGYANTEGKIIAEVEGYENVEDAIKLCLSEDGELYYGFVLLKPVFDDNMNANGVVLFTVTYDDGSTEMFRANVHEMSDASYKKRGELQLDWVNEIPVLTVKDFRSGMMKPYAEEMKESDAVVLNLQSNQGGYMDTCTAWYEGFCGEVPTSNNLMFYRDYKNALSHVPGYQKVNEEAAVMWSGEDKFVDNDRLVILLTNKECVSSGELFTDMAHNLENTLIIGENTAGGLLNGYSDMRTLPYSKALLQFGNSVHLWPEGYFEEGKGLEPDIWCPGWYAEEAVLKFIEKNVK